MEFVCFDLNFKASALLTLFQFDVLFILTLDLAAVPMFCIAWKKMVTASTSSEDPWKTAVRTELFGLSHAIHIKVVNGVNFQIADALNGGLDAYEYNVQRGLWDLMANVYTGTQTQCIGLLKRLPAIFHQTLFCLSSLSFFYRVAPDASTDVNVTG